MTVHIKTLGSDPEVLLHDGTKFRSAIGIVPGEKGRPHAVKDGAVHVDNVTGEINTRPVETAREFDEVCESVLLQLDEIVQTHGVFITEDSVADYEACELKHPTAREAGCDVDWNAYTKQLNNPPSYRDTSLRCAGGHIHVGADMSSSETVELIRALDVVITLPMLIFERQPERRLYYGKAGSFRATPYGVEYRTPSNFWLFAQDRRVWIAEAIRDAAKYMKTLQNVPSVDSIINNYMPEKAHEIITRLGVTPCPY